LEVGVQIWPAELALPLTESLFEELKESSKTKVLLDPSSSSLLLSSLELSDTKVYEP
jgi:hypothetical protein